VPMIRCKTVCHIQIADVDFGVQWYKLTIREGRCPLWVESGRSPMSAIG